jgi:hypothetical protein
MSCRNTEHNAACATYPCLCSARSITEKEIFSANHKRLKALPARRLMSFTFFVFRPGRAIG